MSLTDWHRYSSNPVLVKGTTNGRDSTVYAMCVLCVDGI